MIEQVAIGGIIYSCMGIVKWVFDINKKPVIDIDKPIKYSFLDVDPGGENIISDYKLSNKLKYEHQEGGKNNLKVCVGISTEGEKVWLNMLNSHLLIAGQSRWGKSCLLNSIVTSFMLSYTKNELRFMLCDYKQLDLKQFEGYEAVIGKCASNKAQFLAQIKWINEKEIPNRIEALKKSGSLNIIKHNKKSELQIPYILYVVDELPQVTFDQECNDALNLSMAKWAAYGIYFILASQDLSKNVIGRCKINVAQTIGLHTRDKVDSDLIIKGANLDSINVKGRCKIDDGEITEFQSFLIEEEEIEDRLKHLRKEG